MNSLLCIRVQGLRYTALIRISKHDVVQEPPRAWQTEICETKYKKSHENEKWEENQCQLSELTRVGDKHFSLQDLVQVFRYKK